MVLVIRSLGPTPLGHPWPDIGKLLMRLDKASCAACKHTYILTLSEFRVYYVLRSTVEVEVSRRQGRPNNRERGSLPHAPHVTHTVHEGCSRRPAPPLTVSGTESVCTCTAAVDCVVTAMQLYVYACNRM